MDHEQDNNVIETKELPTYMSRWKNAVNKNGHNVEHDAFHFKFPQIL